MLFFLDLGLVLYHFFDGARGFVGSRGRLLDGWLGSRSSLDHLGNHRRRLGSHYGFYRSFSGGSGSQFGFLLQTLGFALATTHFTWVVWCATGAGQGADRSGLDNRRSHFGGRCFNRCCRCGNHRLGNYWFSSHDFCDWRRRFGNDRLGGMLEGTRRFLGWLCRWCLCDWRFDHWLGNDCRLFCNNSRLRGLFFTLFFTGLGDFNSRRCWNLYCSGGLDDRCFDGRCGFLDGSGGTFGLLMSLGFGRGADHGAGNGGGYRQARGQIGAAWLFAVFFRTFDHIAVGVTLALTTVAATTLATGAAARTIAFGVLLAVFLQLLFVRQQLFFSDGSGLFGAWLTLFTRWTRLTLFAWLASRTLFSGSGSGRSSVQRFAQFTHTLFTLATWLAVFAWWAWLTLFPWRTWRALFASGGLDFLASLADFTWLTLFAGFARCAFFTRGAFFAWLAFFVAATVTVAALLTTVAAFFVARRTLGGRFFNHDRSGWLFLGGEQADQGFHQALEQAWLGNGGRGGNRSGGNFGWNRCIGAGWSSLDGGFLANQGAGRGGWLDFFGFGSGSGDFVAGLVDAGFRAVIAQTLDFEVRRFEMVVRQNDDTSTGAQFDLGDRIAFFVEQEGRDRNRHLGANFGGAIFQGFFFDQAQDRQRQRFDVADDAGAVAAWADDAAAFAEGWAQTLTGHFQQAEARDATDLDASAVGFQAFADFLFHGALVLGRGHVDEVDDDQAADVTQAQLASDFFRCFQVGLQGGFLDVAAFGGASRVDVDGHQGFGRIDNDGTTGRQLDDALEGGFDLAFDLETVEQRDAVFVQLDLAGVLRHHLANEGQGFVLGLTLSISTSPMSWRR